jgi:hypothetical protein
MSQAFEDLLLSLWQEILGVDVVSSTTSFLELGGTSLGAEKIASRFRASTGISITGVDVLRTGTIEKMLELIRRKQSMGGPLRGPHA